MPINEDDRRIGERVARARCAASLSQTGLANAMKVAGFPFHQQTIAKIERGAKRLRLSEALALARVLRCDMRALAHDVTDDGYAAGYRDGVAAARDAAAAGIAELLGSGE